MKKKIQIYKNILNYRINLYQEKRKLSKLAKHRHPSIKAIGKALLETYNNDLSKEELKWIQEIEERRKLLEESEEVIPVIDYGAGKSGQNRTQEEMKRGVSSSAKVCDVTKASKPKLWATIIFKLIKHLKPYSSIELGTCVGISAAYIAVALKMNGTGKLHSLEGSPEVANIAKETLFNLSLNNTEIQIGPFQNTLSKVLEIAKPIDFFFNDGHHDYDAVLKYFNDSLPYLAEDSVMVFDDISWSEGMRKAWREIEDHNKVRLSIDLNYIGIVYIGKDLSKKKKMKISVFDHLELNFKKLNSCSKS